MQQVATAVCPSDGVAGVVIAKQMRKLPIIPHLHTVHVHFPNLWIKLNPVSSLWESSNHFEPFFTTHTNGLGSVPFTAPVLPENECYSSAFLPVSHMTVHKSHWSFTFFFLLRHRFPHLSFTGHRILSFSFTEITSEKYLVTKTGWPHFFLILPPAPPCGLLLWSLKQMPALDVEIYMEGEHLLFFFAKNLF